MHSLSIKQVIRTIEELVWYFFLFALPFQFRHIFGFQPLGFVEWNAFSLYATDLLLIALLVLAIWHRGIRIRRDWIPLAVLVFLVASGLSAVVSSHHAVSWYRVLKLAEGLLLFWYMRNYVVGRFSLESSLAAVVAGGLVQSGIAIAQFVQQSDLGLWWLGEPMLSPAMKGIASFYTAHHDKIIRAYGTMPHPNVLGVYLIASIVALWWMVMRDERVTWRIWAVPYGILLFGFWLTFSRTVIFAAVAGLGLSWLMLWLRQPHLRRKLMHILVVTAIYAGAFVLVFWPYVWARFTIAADEEAVTLRVFYGKQALHAGHGILGHVSGVGIGNFVNWLMKYAPNLPAYMYQPAHNVYLLVYAEMGWFGILSFVASLGLIIRAWMRSHLPSIEKILGTCLLGVFLFVAFFDHFPWTLQQGVLMWWLLLGLVAAPSVDA
jgi:hypothetical protein